MAAGAAALGVAVLEPLAEEEAAPEEEEDCDALPVLLAPELLAAPDEVDEAVVAVGTAPPVSLSRPATSVTAMSSEMYSVSTPVFVLEPWPSVSEWDSEKLQLAWFLDEVRAHAAVTRLFFLSSVSFSAGARV